MNNTIITKSTSRVSAITEDIVLREGEITRLVFHPILIENSINPEASVKGTFIFQRKSKLGSWKDYKIDDLSKFKSGDGYRLDLHTDELYKFITELIERYDLFGEHGIRFGTNRFIFTPSNIETFVDQLINDPLYFKELKSLNNRENLEKINVVTNIGKLESAISLWQNNKTNPDESFWHEFIMKESWLFSQVFSTPVILFKSKAYMGGKDISNQNASVTDILLKNKLTDHAMIIEIKTPETKILGNEYRGTYAMGAELTGGENQLLQQKDKLYKEFYTIKANSEESFSVFNPKCLLVIGNCGKLDRAQKDAFELHRRNSTNVEIITYDELFAKIQILKDLLSKTSL